MTESCDLLTTSWLRSLEAKLLARRWRGLLQLQGDQQWALQLANDVADKLALKALIIGQDNGHAQYNQIQQLLGSDQQLVIFNAYAGFHANAFALVAGSLKAGALLMLISPEDQQWKSYKDPDLKRFTQQSGIWCPKTQTWSEIECKSPNFLLF